MRMRIANSRALAGDVSLCNASGQSRAAFEKYRDTPDDEPLEMALAIVRGA